MDRLTGWSPYPTPDSPLVIRRLPGGITQVRNRNTPYDAPITSLEDEVWEQRKAELVAQATGIAAVGHETQAPPEQTNTI